MNTEYPYDIDSNTFHPDDTAARNAVAASRQYIAQSRFAYEKRIDDAVDYLKKRIKSKQGNLTQILQIVDINNQTIDRIQSMDDLMLHVRKVE